MQQSRSLTEGSIGRRLLQFSLPILGSNVLLSLNGSVNAIWVGRYLGEAALTAVANAQSVMLLLSGAAFGIAMAATILIGQCVGADKVDEAKRVVRTGAAFFIITSVVIAITGVVLAERLLILMNSPGDSLSLAVIYLRILFLALPCLYMYSFVSSILLGTGDSKTPFCFTLISVSMTAILNPVLIFGMGPFPRAGIAGSALATLIAQATSVVALIAHLYWRRHPLCCYRNEIARPLVDWSTARALVGKGVPMGAQVLVFSLSSVLMIVLVNRFGVETTAAYGALIQLWQYIQLPAMAIGVAASMITAQNVGAQKWDRIRSVARVGVLCSVLLTSSIIFVIYALGTYAYRLFLPAGSPALDIAAHINSVATWSFVFMSIPIVLFGIVRATGAVMAPLVIQILSLLCVRFALAATLVDRWQADAIWWSFPISAGVAVALATLYYRYGGWRAGRLRIPASVGTGRTPSTTEP